MSRVQAAADLYLGRMREEGRWNRRGRTTSEAHGPRLPELPSASECEEASASEVANLWSTGRAETEAKEFYALLGRNGETAEVLRETIGVSGVELKELSEWAEAEPYLASHIQAMIDYRMEVLAEFNRLVENDAAESRSQTAVAVQRLGGIR
jgi:hypothetical protein